MRWTERSSGLPDSTYTYSERLNETGDGMFATEAGSPIVRE
jgi:hypothetical protein